MLRCNVDLVLDVAEVQKVLDRNQVAWKRDYRIGSVEGQAEQFVDLEYDQETSVVLGAVCFPEPYQDAA